MFIGQVVSAVDANAKTNNVTRISLLPPHHQPCSDSFMPNKWWLRPRQSSTAAGICTLGLFPPLLSVSATSPWSCSMSYVWPLRFLELWWYRRVAVPFSANGCGHTCKLHAVWKDTAHLRAAVANDWLRMLPSKNFKFVTHGENPDF